MHLLFVINHNYIILLTIVQILYIQHRKLIVVLYLFKTFPIISTHHKCMLSVSYLLTDCGTLPRVIDRDRDISNLQALYKVPMILVDDFWPATFLFFTITALGKGIVLFTWACRRHLYIYYQSFIVNHKC